MTDFLRRGRRCRLMKSGGRKWACALGLVVHFLQPLAGTGEPYTLVFIPDTQFVPADDDTVHQQVQWILDHKVDRNIVFVGHLGDVVDDPSETEKFLNVSEAMSLLQGGPIEIPYSVVPGNHDATPVNGTSYADYLVHFGPERYAEFSWFGGAMPNLGIYTGTENNSEDVNHYSFIDTGNGYEILHFGMEYRQAHVTISNWVRSIIAAHPGLPVLITSHRNVEILDIQTGACGTLDNGLWWEQLLRHEANIFFTINGHEFLNVDSEC
ncbi:MAG: metallophosphoesterase, partial [Myxococcota bacterium]